MNNNLNRIILLGILTLVSISSFAQVYPVSDWNYVVPYSDQEMIETDINVRNLLFFRFENDDELRFQGQPIEVSDVREIVKVYLKNEKDNSDLPKPLYRSRYENGKTIYMRYTNYFICLVKDASVSAENPLVRYALHEIIEAIAELRVEYCKKYYGVEYIECNIYQREVLKEMLPCKIRFGNHKFTPPPPPPPAVQTIDVLSFSDDADSSSDAVAAIDNSDYDDVVFMVVEQMPEFPGGQQAMMKFISEELEYPTAARENGIQGRTICSFVVNKDGSIVDVVAVRSSGDRYLDQEAIRVIQSMPKWTPGKQKGQPVRVKYTLPVNFRLTDNDNKK